MEKGTGKTLTVAAVIKLFLKTGNARRVIFLVDRIEIEDQAQKAFKQYLGRDYHSVIYKEARDSWKHAQVETEISYMDLRRGGYKNIANMAMYANEAFTNKKIKYVFSTLDSAISGGTQVFAVTGGESALTKTVMDKLSLYVLDQLADGDEGLVFGLNKYAQAIANMSGYTSYMSDTMKNDYNN